MLAIDDILPCVVLSVLIVGFVRGVYNVAVGGFLRLALGALLVAAIFSIFLSAASSLLLEQFAKSERLQGQFIFFRAALAGLAQPTLTGVALLGCVLVVGYGCSMVHHFVEDITILLRSHDEIAKAAADAQKKSK